jgi:hypothetical protein
MLEWLQNPYVAIGLAVVAMFFGYFFGLFEGRGQGYKRRQAEEDQVVEKNEPETQVEPMPAASPALPPDETSILDVSRDNAGGMRLKLDGQRIEAATINPEQRKRIIAVLTQIRPWLEAAAPAPQPQPVSSPKEAPTAGTIPAPVPGPSSRRASAPASDARPTVPPVDGEKEAAPAPVSIVAQVDAILQAQLAGTPLVERGVRLQESPEGGVIVWVGMSKYDGIDDVPDDQIKAAIRFAITTWENKYTPGL